MPNARSVKKKSETHILKDTRCYLIGHMQYCNGRSWRDTAKKQLSPCGITFFDPYYKPFLHDIPEDENARKQMLGWMQTGQYDLVQKRMWDVRAYDLRLCDVCDFFIANIRPEIASWGSAEEITTVIRAKKPVFLSIDHPDGKKACPLWLLGAIPHKYVYNNIEEVIETIKAIDNNTIRLNSDRWKLLRPELR